MKKNFKRIFAFMLFLCVSLIPNYGAYAGQNNADYRRVEEAVLNIENLYSECYIFGDYSVIELESSETKDLVSKEYLLEIEKQIKVDSVEEFDYVQGIYSGLNDIMSEMEDEKAWELLEIKAQEMVDDLARYIGKTDILQFYIRIDYKKSNPLEYMIYYDNGVRFVPLSDLRLLSKEDLYKNGYNKISLEADLLMGEDNQKSQRTASYSVHNAVTYAETYTSTPSSCNLHSSCSYQVDTTIYNPAYTHYASTHSDCANFVSQIMRAGGIPITSSWNTGTISWINVTQLVNYMTSNSIWGSVSSPSVGDVARYTGVSHIVFISAFDGFQYYFSAHTNDRKNYPLTSSCIYYSVNI